MSTSIQTASDWEDNEIAIVDTTKKKRGSKSASIEHTYTGEVSKIGMIVNNSARYFNTKPVQSDDETAERLNTFFQECSTYDNFPTVEKMALCLGIDRTTLWRWSEGEGVSATRCNMIKKAREMMAAIDGELAAKRQIPESTYIFRSKNFHGMRDVQDHIITASSPMGEPATQEELQLIRDKYLTD